MKRWVLAAMSMAACSEREPATTAADGATSAGGDRAHAVECVDEEPHDFLVVYGDRALAGTGELDMFVMPATAWAPAVSLTERLAPIGVSCHQGCYVDADLESVAVQIGHLQPGGFDVRLASLGPCLTASPVPDSLLEGKAHVELAGGYVFYSQSPDCHAEICVYEIWRAKVDAPLDAELLVEAMPPSTFDWETSYPNYHGAFRVAFDGSMVAMQVTTISSMSIYLWSASSLRRVDYLCAGVMKGERCDGTGSKYTEQGPLAISPDGKTAVAFLVENTKSVHALQVRRYDFDDPLNVRVSPILSVGGLGKLVFEQAACKERKYGEPIEVVGDPVFTPDGESVVFIGRAHCGALDDKAETDIWRIAVDGIGDGDAFKHMTKLTQNPKTNGPENIEISEVAVSPDGARVVFLGTPSVKLGLTSTRASWDREVYMTTMCGNGLAQLTSSATKRGTGLRTVPWRPLSGCSK